MVIFVDDWDHFDFDFLCSGSSPRVNFTAGIDYYFFKKTQGNYTMETTSQTVGGLFKTFHIFACMESIIDWWNTV